MYDYNLLCKIFCPIILVIAFVFNTIGNWAGVGDIIPTDKCLFGSPEHGTTITEESTTLPSTEAVISTTSAPVTQSTTKVETTTQTTTQPTTESTTEPTTTTTTQPTTITTTTQPTTTTTQPTTTATTTTTTKISTTTTTRKSTTQNTTPDADTKVTFYGKTFNYAFKEIEATTDGGYVACGSFGKEGVGSKRFAVKFDKDSNIVWEKVFDDTFFFDDVAVLDNGSVILAGYQKITEEADTEIKGNSEALLLSLSENDGSVLFTKTFSGNNTDAFSAVAALSDGCFAVGGKTNSTKLDFADSSGERTVLMSLDSEGNVVWKKYATGSRGASIENIATDKYGNIFVAYLTSSTDGDFAGCEELTGGYVDTVVMKYSSGGTYKWDYVIATSGRDEFTAIAADNLGGCVIGGQYELIGTVIPDGTLSSFHNCGGIDAAVFYISSNGSVKWTKQLAGINDDYITDISKASKGYAISGYTNSGNRDFAEIGNLGETDGYVCFVNASGTTVEMFSQAGSLEDASTCIAARTTNSKFMVAGRTNSVDGNFEANTNKSTIFTGYVAAYEIG